MDNVNLLLRKKRQAALGFSGSARIRILLPLLCCLLLCVPCALANSRPWYNVSQDTITAVTEFSTTAINNWYTDCWASSITTVSGSTYFAYVDPNFIIRVGKMTGDSVTVVEMEPGYTTADDGHNEACIAVDKDGYIHVMGNMHLNAFRYWRSNQPYSITDGFTRHFGAIPGTFTYYAFRKDRNNELYMYARGQVLKDTWAVGSRGVCLYRYNRTSRTWTARGALAPHPNAAYPILFWDSTGQHGGSYQMFKADVRFDNNNRLHFTSTINQDGAPATCNYAVYAYSDDEGVTFKKADGTVLTLPVMIDAGSSQGDVIDGYYAAGMGEHSGLFLDDQNRPGVHYSIDGKTWSRFWDGSSWQTRLELATSQWGRAFALSDRYGTQTLVYGSSWKRFEDFGVAPVNFNTEASVYRWDLEALRDYETYRGIDWYASGTSSTGSWKIIRFDITNPTTEGLTARPLTSSRIDLNWPAEPGATSYTLKRSTNRGGPYTIIASGLTATGYSNTGLTASTAYYYVLSAVVGAVEGPDRPEVSASTYMYNLAYSKNITASSTSGLLVPGNAADANTDTRWSSNYSDPQWIRVDLGGYYEVGSVRLRWEAAYAAEYRIELSTNGTTWTTAYSTTTGAGGVEDISFTPAIARYVRMYGTRRATTYGYSLWEFEVYRPVSTADFNQDGDVDLMDFSRLAGDWQKTGTNITDLTGTAGTPDGIVDIQDLLQFSSQWLD